MKHEPYIATLGEIIDGISERAADPWYEIMDIDIPGIKEAEAAEQWDAASEIEREYLIKHENDKYRVLWPEHVLTPRYNSDATYCLEESSPTVQ